MPMNNLHNTMSQMMGRSDIDDGMMTPHGEGVMLRNPVLEAITQKLGPEGIPAFMITPYGVLAMQMYNTDEAMTQKLRPGDMPAIMRTPHGGVAMQIYNVDDTMITKLRSGDMTRHGQLLMPKFYKDNRMNREIGRDGMPVGSMPCSKGSSGSVASGNERANFCVNARFPFGGVSFWFA